MSPDLIERCAIAAWEEAAKPHHGLWFSGMTWQDAQEEGMLPLRNAFIACTRAVLAELDTVGILTEARESGLIGREEFNNLLGNQ